MILVIIAAAIVILCAIFLFAVYPSVKGHPDLELLKGAQIAHRGLHDLEPGTPENSLPSFEAAAQKGYIIENDIHVTADGEVVIFHDHDPKRMCGVEGKLEEMTLAEIKQLRLLDTDLQIPTLQECLDLVDGRVPFLIEFKCTDMQTCERLCKAANEILSNYKGKYFVQSFYPPAMGWYKKHRKDVCRGQLSCAFRNGGPLRNKLLACTMFNFISRPHFLSYCHQDESHPCRRLNTLLGAFPVGWTYTNQQDIEKTKSKFNTYIFEGFIPEK